MKTRKVKNKCKFYDRTKKICVRVKDSRKRFEYTCTHKKPTKCLHYKTLYREKNVSKKN